MFFRVLATILSFKIFNMSKNMAAVTTNRTGGSESSFSQITRKRKQISNSVTSLVIQHDKIYLLCDFCDDPWNRVGVIALFVVFSSPGPKVHVSYCHHLASVVRRLSSSSSVNFSSKIFSSETTGWIATKLGHYGPWYI